VFDITLPVFIILCSTTGKTHSKVHVGGGGGGGGGGSGTDRGGTNNNNGDVGGSYEEQLTSLPKNIVADLTIADSE